MTKMCVCAQRKRYEPSIFNEHVRAYQKRKIRVIFFVFGAKRRARDIVTAR